MDFLAKHKQLSIIISSCSSIYNINMKKNPSVIGINKKNIFFFISDKTAEK